MQYFFWETCLDETNKCSDRNVSIACVFDMQGSLSCYLTSYPRITSLTIRYHQQYFPQRTESHTTTNAHRTPSARRMAWNLGRNLNPTLKRCQEPVTFERRNFSEMTDQSMVSNQSMVSEAIVMRGGYQVYRHCIEVLRPAFPPSLIYLLRYLPRHPSLRYPHYPLFAKHVDLETRARCSYRSTLMWKEKPVTRKCKMS